MKKDSYFSAIASTFLSTVFRYGDLKDLFNSGCAPEMPQAVLSPNPHLLSPVLFLNQALNASFMAFFVSWSEAAYSS